MDVSHFVYAFGRNLGCFHFLAIVNDVPKIIHIQVFVGAPVSTTLGYIPRGGMAGSHGNYVLLLEAFAKRPHHFAFPPAVCESLMSPHPRPRSFCPFQSLPSSWV